MKRNKANKQACIGGLTWSVSEKLKSEEEPKYDIQIDKASYRCTHNIIR
jgi:hypothetical protein